jgi:Family of unknown function (DUF5719)
MSRSPLAALWIPAGVVAVLGVAAFVGPPESVVRDRPGHQEPVVRTTAVCPFVGGEAQAKSYLGVLPAGTAATDQDDPEPEPVTSQVLLGPEKKAKSVLSTTTAGALTAAEIETEDPHGYAVRGVGSLAPGLAAEQFMLASGPDFRGLVSTRCVAPARDFWFVGGSGEVGRRGRLVLSNPTSVPAVVDVSVWDESGPVDPPATKDIAIPARSQHLLLLDALDPTAERIGVAVSASQGRIAASLEVRENDRLDPQGVTFIPAAAAPATEVVVPGVPNHGDRTLRILAPGDSDAIVSLRLLGPDGPFSPVGQDVVTVPAGTVAEVPIGEGAGEAAVSVELASDVPVTASVRVVDARSDAAPELAYTAATAAVDGPAPALLGPNRDGLKTRLLLTALGDLPARATVRSLKTDGTIAEEQTVDVPGESTVTVAVKAVPKNPWTTVIVEPAEPGTVTVTREIVGSDDDGALLDLLPLVAPVVTVQVPEVAGELPTGLAPAGPINR